MCLAGASVEYIQGSHSGLSRQSSRSVSSQGSNIQQTSAVLAEYNQQQQQQQQQQQRPRAQSLTQYNAMHQLSHVVAPQGNQQHQLNSGSMREQRASHQIAAAQAYGAHHQQQHQQQQLQHHNQAAYAAQIPPMGVAAPMQHPYKQQQPQQHDPYRAAADYMPQQQHSQHPKHQIDMSPPPPPVQSVQSNAVPHSSASYALQHQAHFLAGAPVEPDDACMPPPPPPDGFGGETMNPDTQSQQQAQNMPSNGDIDYLRPQYGEVMRMRSQDDPHWAPPEYLARGTLMPSVPCRCSSIDAIDCDLQLLPFMITLRIRMMN